MVEENEPFDYQVLAAAFKIPGAVKRFAEELNPQDVGLIHGLTGIHEIYKNLLSYHKVVDSDLIDPIAFQSWLESETDIVDALGGRPGLDKLISTLLAIELSSLDSIIKLTEFRGRKRRQLDKVQELKSLISNKAQASEADMAKISALTEQIQSLEKDLKYDPMSSVRTGNDIANSLDELWNVVPFLPTQYPSLNKALGYSELTGGVPRACVTSIVAMSGFGKSTLARCLCNHWLDQGETVLFINYEEAKEHWERTLMTQVVLKNIYAEVNNLSPQEKNRLSERFKAKLNEWGDRLMVRHDPDTLFYEDLEKWLRDVLGHGVRKPDIIVIDTIQSLFTKSGGRARWGEFEQIMVGLEKLAKDMNAAIITAQQNINATKEKREVINQSDMGGSVTITQKSSVVLFITPVKDVTGDETFNENIMQIQIPKNRITGTTFSSNPPMIKYDDSIKSYVPHVEVEEYTEEFIDDLDLGETY
jgi:replicative DNA helicase